jgi:hypothetical protein
MTRRGRGDMGSPDWVGHTTARSSRLPGLFPLRYVDAPLALLDVTRALREWFVPDDKSA